MSRRQRSVHSDRCSWRPRALHTRAHFPTTLDKSREEFGDLLRWYWPCAYGDGGPLGTDYRRRGLPDRRLLPRGSQVDVWRLQLAPWRGSGSRSPGGGFLASIGAALLL